MQAESIGERGSALIGLGKYEWSCKLKLAGSLQRSRRSVDYAHWKDCDSTLVFKTPFQRQLMCDREQFAASLSENERVRSCIIWASSPRGNIHRQVTEAYLELRLDDLLADVSDRDVEHVQHAAAAGRQLAVRHLSREPTALIQRFFWLSFHIQRPYKTSFPVGLAEINTTLSKTD